MTGEGLASKERLAHIRTVGYEFESPLITPTPSAVDKTVSRRALLRTAAAGMAALAIPFPLAGLATPETDQGRLDEWLRTLDEQNAATGRVGTGRLAARVGELAIGTPYEAATLEAYIRRGGSPTATEPLALSLTRFDCVSLVEASLAVARVFEANPPGQTSGDQPWKRFGREIEKMRYRAGMRAAYSSRLHYFSEWISDGARRGLLRDLGAELGGAEDARPLRFMTEHRSSYAALADGQVFREIGEMERGLDNSPRRVISTAHIPDIADGIQTGDVLAFATSIPGLDVSHAAFAYRGSDRVLRVLHAPLSGGAVEITKSTLPEYVSAIRRGTGILVARPLARKR
ncbi:MAG: DUF1460 domain-containing protein [Gemmatimonadaceae bacterium]|nr:DUF1460 domain-containing protein [Gemmatimonadaceae bacterium]